MVAATAHVGSWLEVVVDDELKQVAVPQRLGEGGRGSVVIALSK
jgi:hypothetical protein